MRATKAVINEEALLHNLQRIQNLAPKSEVIAVIKANAYGHGIEQVANILKGKVNLFGVACTEEAILLRESGISERIVLLEGLFEAEELALVDHYNLELVIHSQYQIDAIKNFHPQAPITVWLKLDSGMHRLGFSPEDFIDEHQRLVKSGKVKLPIGLMTHFSDADDPTLATTQKQHDLFKKLTANFLGPRTEANSAAIMAWPETHQSHIRPGLLLYGCSPLLDKEGAQHGLKPVMTLESQLIAINKVNKNETVGYGSTWKTDKDTHIGVIAIGYGDGYPRHAKSGTPVWINNRLVSMVGRVSMDMITVDLGMDCTDQIGDRVILWGPELPLERIAACANTVSYELLCGISRRVKFTYCTKHEPSVINMK